VRQAFEAEDPATVLAPLVDALHDLIKAMRALPFPVVAAVEGPAVGAGMGLALATDVRVIATSAIFLPGYMAIGASPDGGTSYFLARSLGGARAASAYLRGKPLPSELLAAAGLADEVVEDGEALSTAEGVAQELAGTPPLALVRMRTLVDRAPTQSLDAQLDLERDLVAELWPSHDFREGVGAFLERRRPTFEGH
jgi:2-(1,2-epoxy-1,2-dihydrophenyl)acetyl-CoA isomerase